MINNADIALSKAMGGSSAELNPSRFPHSSFQFVTELRFPNRHLVNYNNSIQ